MSLAHLFCSYLLLPCVASRTANDLTRVFYWACCQGHCGSIWGGISHSPPQTQGGRMRGRWPDRWQMSYIRYGDKVVQKTMSVRVCLALLLKKTGLWAGIVWKYWIGGKLISDFILILLISLHKQHRNNGSEHDFPSERRDRRMTHRSRSLRATCFHLEGGWCLFRGQSVTSLSHRTSSLNKFGGQPDLQDY